MYKIYLSPRLKNIGSNCSSCLDLGFNLRSPTIENKNGEAASDTVNKAQSQQSGRIISLLLRLRAFESLRFREYRLLWYGQIFASMGMWMDEVARGWLIYELTNSAVQLGLVRGIQTIPFLLLSPVAGSAADRYSRKTQVLVAQFVSALVYTATALLIFTGQIQPWHVYVTAFLMAVVQTFIQPARNAMICDTVPPACLTNAIGLSAIVFNVSRSTGPALAGILIAVLGTGSAYFAQAVSFFLATLWTLQLHSDQRPSTNADGHSVQRESFRQSIIEGWKLSWKKEEIRIGILTVMIVSLFITPFTTLLPVFARDLLGVGAKGQGLLLTAMGIGALCSSVLIASAGDKLPRGMLMLGSVALYGFIVVLFAASPWFQLSLVLMGISGLCTVHSHALVATVIQSYSPSEFRGRTMAIFNMSQVVITVGSMFIGALSSLLGARWAVASMGAAGTLTIIIVYLSMPRARLIR